MAKETLTYTVTGAGEALAQLERLMKMAEILGNWGCSRRLMMPFDGDGADYLQVKELKGRPPL